MPVQQNKNQPDAKGLAWQTQARAVELMRDVYEGTFRLRSRHNTYLPQFPLETAMGYNARVNSAVLFNATKRTVGGLNGMVFRKDPVFSNDEAAPSNIQEHAENIDLAGRSLWTFARDVGENALLDGHTHIFVDMPRVDADAVRTLAHDEAAQIRPYWINVLKQDLLSFRYDLVNGHTILSQIAFRETTTEPDGAFGEKVVERIRVYQLLDGVVVFTLWRKQDSATGGEQWFIEKRGATTATEIMLVTIYSNRRALLVSSPPLEDLAHENVLHFQLRSDRMNTLHIAGVPIPWFSGVSKDSKLGVGSDLAIRMENPESKAGYLEPTGNSLSETREELLHTEKRMATLGLAILQKDTRVAETATAARMDKSEGDSILSSFAKNLEMGLNEALRMHAAWLGLESGGKVVVNEDFESLTMDATMVQTLSNLVGMGQLSQETMWERLVQGEVLPDNFDADLELARLGGTSSLEGFVREVEGNGRQPESEPEEESTAA